MLPWQKDRIITNKIPPIATLDRLTNLLLKKIAIAAPRNDNPKWERNPTMMSSLPMGLSNLSPIIGYAIATISSNRLIRSIDEIKPM
jgi:hypothetical protein